MRLPAPQAKHHPAPPIATARNLPRPGPLLPGPLVCPGPDTTSRGAHPHLHHTPVTQPEPSETTYVQASTTNQAPLFPPHATNFPFSFLRSRSMEIIDAELRLGPPGSSSGVDLAFAAAAAQKKRPSSSSAAAARSEASGTDDHDNAPACKVQVVGWPPVCAYRKSTFQQPSSPATKSKDGHEQEAAAAGKQRSGGGGGLYVKVSMDGAPYLRKVDLRTYGGYGELRDALDKLFGCFSSPDACGAGQFAVAYEDKDGDLMLAGDVPWDMFIGSCKRLRIMRGSEAR
uniref:Uncharacterized protein n=1 Tax=Avena sativa TaxID=4498 RepID=A0ACD5X8E8_AVESA